MLLTFHSTFRSIPSAIMIAMLLGNAICEHLTIVSAASPQGIAFFESKIRPALIEHCLDCHSHDSDVSGNLSLDSRQDWEQGGDLGPAIASEAPDASLLIKAIEYDDPDLQMPPEGKLDDATIEAFRHWISIGAPDPRKPQQPSPDTEQTTALTVEQAQNHWSYRPIDHNLVTPRLHGSESGSIVDAWIDKSIQSAGLEASPPATRRVLARRLSLDLCGLPPTKAMVDAFVADRSDDAYARYVDRLLSSPAYGEHIARRWMDVVRYAESITLRGFILPEAWRYRDYLIESFNDDRPFDQMIRDQISGDLRPVEDLRETQRRAIATGFLAMGNSNLEDQDKTKLEFDHLDEQIETIGRAFLAQTIGCARCHDHKFDPIPTRDYYALAGIFRSTTPLKHANLSKWIDNPLPLTEKQEDHYRELQRDLEDVAARIKSIDKRIGGDTKGSAKAIAVDSVAGVVVDDADATYVGQWKTSDFVKPFVGQGYQHTGIERQEKKSATFDPESLETGDYEVRIAYSHHANRATNATVTVFSANESKVISVNQRRVPSVDGVWHSLGTYPFEKGGQAFVIVSNDGADGIVIVDAVQFLPVAQSDQIPSGQVNETQTAELEQRRELQKQRSTLVTRQKRLQSELAARPKYLTISESEPQVETNIRVRGNPHQLGDRVPRGFLAAVGPAQEYANQIDSSSSGRRELADWIADRRNPLTARVYVNRVWSWMMGEGLVPTENNFGTTGRQPSHPELLDQLAIELVNNQWSTKHLIRLIVNSDAYRRSIDDDAQSRSLDPENRHYAFGRLKRLPVESVRDAMLFVSGELQRDRFGSTIRPGTKSDYDYEHRSNRRSIYQPVFRNSLPALFEDFDFADSSISVGQRSRSTIVSQSLAMMNDPWVIRRCEQAAHRLMANDESAGNQLISELYHLCFARPPSDRERALCLRFLERHGDDSIHTRVADLIQSLFASTDFRYLE
ncbi:DUF1553 domain-containing protein [Roseiconus lacunae]|uniref:DUF1553 domain-containing protein n=1 Tax=Roseiconus lacunae TaxID=2605694 RepID=A0ABT7PRN0_9BACT|nr:DUF1553 domain-containing protein [Roseiconus lacunae]MDM4019165.1 DUF1553 domain-containing protein [Roseiconus lacunae]